MDDNENQDSKKHKNKEKIDNKAEEKKKEHKHKGKEDSKEMKKEDENKKEHKHIEKEDSKDIQKDEEKEKEHKKHKEEKEKIEIKNELEEKNHKKRETELLRSKPTDITDIKAGSPISINKSETKDFIEKEKENDNTKQKYKIDNKENNYKIENNKGTKAREKKEKIKKKYLDKKKEIKKLEAELKDKEYLIEVKKDKEKTLKNNLENDKKHLEREMKSFYNKITEEENKLKEEEKKLVQKEEKLRRKKEFYIPPNNPPLLIGLKNIEAASYINALLQCFSNTKKLTEYFLYDYKEDKKKIFSNEYYHLLKELWKKENNNKPSNPTFLKDILCKENNLFSSKEVNDSKDLINFLLEKFHKELNEVKKNNKNQILNNITQIDRTSEDTMLNLFIKDFEENYNSQISNLFYGVSKTKSQCTLCKIINFEFNIYSFLEFPLQQVNQYFYSIGKRQLFTNDGKNPGIDLYECFEYYLRQENNQMHCNLCHKNCNLVYSKSLYSGPNYLIIILNRGKGVIYECNVNFPEQLNLINFITTKDINVYELYAVVCYLSQSSVDGNFVAYCKNRIDNKWYLYNDDKVYLCNQTQQYNDGMPYILFYKLIIKHS